MEMLVSLLGTQGAGFAMLGAVLLVMFLAGKWTATLSSSNTRLSNLDTSITSINETLSGLNGDIRFIKNTIEKQQRDIDGLAMHNSPIQLTEKGKEVKKQLNTTQLLANHWEKIESDILNRREDSSNPYDIQQICFDYFSNLDTIFTKDEVDQIKLVAYNRGESITSYDIVFGIETRNKIFEVLHINVEEIDLHGPIEK